MHMQDHTIRNAVIGAIIGDIVGSRFEFANWRDPDFVWMDKTCFFTDDTVLTLATLWALIEGRDFAEAYRRFGRAHPDAGYGSRFIRWLYMNEPRPYGSKGNGAAMRVSPIAQVHHRDGLEVCDRLAIQSASVTHDHPEGIRAARAVTHAIYHALIGDRAAVLRVAAQFGYLWHTTVADLRRSYQYSELAEDTVPPVFVCFQEASDFESCVRNAVSIGGDADTLGAIAGSIAGAFFGIPGTWVERARAYLTPDLAALYDIALQYC